MIYRSVAARSSIATTTAPTAVAAASTAGSARAAVAPAATSMAAIARSFAVVALACGHAHGLGVGFAKLFHRGLAAQLDPAGVVDQDHLHLHLVADLHVILDALDILIAQLRD